MNTELTMKRLLVLFLTLIPLVIGCKPQPNNQVIVFGLSAEYPPFEYYQNGELKGFDVDLAYLIAEKLGKKAVFQNMVFNSLLPALQSGQIDAVISTITITDEREKNFSFSDSYYTESLAALFLKNQKMISKNDIANKTVACQMGSTMEIWLKKYFPNSKIVSLDTNPQAVQALKAGQVDLVLMDGVQGVIFSKNNPGLSYFIVAKSDNGYGIAFPKNSKLQNQVNLILKELIKSGAIKKLEEKWMEKTEWQN